MSIFFYRPLRQVFGQHLVNTLQKITPRFPENPFIDFFADILIINIMVYPLMSLEVPVFPHFYIEGVVGKPVPVQVRPSAPKFLFKWTFILMSNCLGFVWKGLSSKIIPLAHIHSGSSLLYKIKEGMQ
ncbi:MAG: hypothetical protein COX51_03165 [Syntrophobacteraceae bacterium CG23_combo_of_CG06-09_8_20_14_all_50_8]|nr:MAG: hypothetical protein COX51_03165 [Syntrophobacteraceae bacterium CG23_combo_of_CG06-09_8_20_14_all_50_8]